MSGEKTTATATVKVNPVLAKVKGFIASDSVKKRFEDVLGKKAPQFISTVMNVVSGNKMLQKCEPTSIIGASLVAASLDLPIDPNLGFAAIVPYYDGKTKTTKAQFQMMYRGFIQLAMRTGQYKKIHVTEVYEDEFVSYNPIENELVFVKDMKECKQRKEGQTDKVVGFFGKFELVSGFAHSLFMTIEEMEAHAKRYSSSYKYDIREKKKTSKWSTDFIPMGCKTVVKLLLSKWGPLSVQQQLQQAIQEDQKIFGEEGGAYKDNPDVIDAAVDNPFSPAITDAALKKEAAAAQDAQVNEDQTPPADDPESIY